MVLESGIAIPESGSMRTGLLEGVLPRNNGEGAGGEGGNVQGPMMVLTVPWDKVVKSGYA